MARTALLSMVLAIWASFASAASVNWTNTTSVSVNFGFENVLVLFGFNPQPEPPAAVLEGDIDPFSAVRRVLGVEPTPFQVFLAFEGGQVQGSPTIVDNLVGVPSAITIDFTTDAGTDLVFRLDFALNNAAVSFSEDPLFFDPQPEPPALWSDGVFGAEVSLVSLARPLTGSRTGLDAQAFFSAQDGSGDPIFLRAGPSPVPIPVPLPFALLAGGLVGLAAYRFA